MKFKELLAVYCRQNAGPFLLGLILALGISRLVCRLLHWDRWLVFVALGVFLAQEIYKFVRFLLDCRS